MNQPNFDVMTRTLSRLPSRRDVLRGLTGAGLGGLLTAGTGSTEAKNGGHGNAKGKNKKGKKVTLCHNGQTITVSKSAVKGHKRHGDTVGPCPSGPTGPTPPGAVLTYECLGPKNDTLTGAGGTDRFVYSFIAERSGSLRHIQFSVNKAAGTTGDFVVQLLKLVGGKPSTSLNDVLATVTVPNAEVATSSNAIVTATFAGPALVSGTEYAAAISRPGTGQGGMEPNIALGDGSACSGKSFLSFSGEPFKELLALDSLVSVRVV